MSTNDKGSKNDMFMNTLLELSGGKTEKGINAYKAFMEGTGNFADASMAARKIYNGQLSTTGIDDLNNALQKIQNSGLLVKNKAQYIPDNRLLQQDGETFPVALNDGELYFKATSLFGNQILINDKEQTVRWRPHPQYDIANQTSGVSNELV